MEYDELARRLRKLSVETGSLACLGCGVEHDCGVRGCRICREAADAIENLQRAVDAHSELGNRMSNLNFGLTDLVLQADITVAAAEERMSAMEDAFRRAAKEFDPCIICVGYNADPPGCEEADMDCEACTNEACRCRLCRDFDKWKLNDAVL